MLFKIIQTLGILMVIIFVVYLVYRRVSTTRIGYMERLTEIHEYGKDDNVGSHDKVENKRLNFDFLEDKMPKKLVTTIKMTGMKSTPGEYMFLWVVSALVPASLLSLMGFSTVFVILAVILGVMIPYFYLEKAKSDARDVFDKQLADALDIIVNCLRIGLTFETALINVAEDMPEPISSEFERVAKEVSVGGDLVGSLEGVAERMQSEYMLLVSTAVIINKEAGGNLAEVLSNIRDSIREGIRLRKHVQTLTAQGRISAIVVAGVPVFIAVMFSIISPGYLDPFFKTLQGNLVLLGCVVVQILGVLWMKDIIKLDF